MVEQLLLREKIKEEKDKPKGDKTDFSKTTLFDVVFYFFNEIFFYLSLTRQSKFFRTKYVQPIIMS